MRNSSKLPALERVNILKGRLENLGAGAGEYYSAYDRQMAILATEEALQLALNDLAKETSANSRRVGGLT
jgi:hypothetical protein